MDFQWPKFTQKGSLSLQGSSFSERKKKLFFTRLWEKLPFGSLSCPRVTLLDVQINFSFVGFQKIMARVNKVCGMCMFIHAFIRHMYVQVCGQICVYLYVTRCSHLHTHTLAHTDTRHFKEGISVRKIKSTTLLHYYLTFCQESS